ncbi:hypothetical protein RvY_11147-2 [Ramazzottius varieornatus]|uniref:Uncharacterized protein n=1 Tax=Ramazzottius varieornatus TaxID=947166 RepID=A0A1D1VJJ7_RAMVA|nr:hypothetical protein RvY_11147-2 [Ramazzottius varieornatus]
MHFPVPEYSQLDNNLRCFLVVSFVSGNLPVRDAEGKSFQSARNGHRGGFQGLEFVYHHLHHSKLLRTAGPHQTHLLIRCQASRLYLLRVGDTQKDTEGTSTNCPDIRHA